MNRITSTAEFFECGGLIICDSAKALAEQLGVNIPDGLNIDDSDVLQMVINYDFYEGGYSYWNGDTIPARRNAVLAIRYYHREETAMTAQCGNFSADIILEQNLKQRTLAGYKKYAEMCCDDVKRLAVQMYIMYCLRNNNKAVSTFMFDRIAGNGSVTLEEVRKAFSA